MILFISADFTEEPQSMSVVAGTVALFQCTGTGNILSWLVNGQPYDDSFREQGVVAYTKIVSKFICSNLTVPTTSEYNATAVTCIITSYVPNKSVFSGTALLYVLPGTVYQYNILLVHLCLCQANTD